MGRMVDGRWRSDVEGIERDDGEFERDETTFRDRVTEDGECPAEPGRYHLYVSRACPWAHRTTIARRLKGLTDVVSLDVVDPIREEYGWEFSPEKEGCTPDTVNGTDFLYEVYAMAAPAYTGRVSVPVLWDGERETIVNNESIEIVRMLDDAFDAFSTRDVTLFPDDVRDEVDATIDEIYKPINNGVYRAGFARSQEAYDRAIADLFEALDGWDDVLADRRYLCGDRLTAADVCLFTTLFRFDEIYNTHFKCNVKRLIDYPNLWNYAKEIYQLPGVDATCNVLHCKEHYYRSHTDLNPTRIVPIGPGPDFSEPHDRDRLPGGPPSALRMESS